MSTLSRRIVLGFVPGSMATAMLACRKQAPPESKTKGSATAQDNGKPQRDAADLIVIGGHVATRGSAGVVEALATRGGVVMALGSRKDIEGLRGPQTTVLDLRGGLATPGFVDGHGHVANLGRGIEEVELRGAKSIDEVVERLRAHESKGPWIFGRGWDQNLWPGAAMPTHDPLTAAFPDRPVWLRRVDGHAGWGNQALLALAGIDEKTKAPAGGEILRDAKGKPTGVLVDAAMVLVQPPEPAKEDVRRWILAAQTHLFERGITGVHDMGVDAAADAVYRELAADTAAGLKLRVHAYADAPWFFADLVSGRPEKAQATTRYALAGVKLYADGALGSRGAALLEPYADRAGHRGLMQQSQEELEQRCAQAMDGQWQLAVHAIGDAGNRAVLDAYERALTRHKAADARPRIEHCQILALDDIPRFAKLGVIASMQPTHATSDMPWVPARIGPDRVAGAYAWKRLLDANARLCFGSDFPVELSDITHGLHAAVTRQDAEQQPEGGWLPDQRLTLDQAMHAYCGETAYASGREGHLGKLDVGYQADITCFGQDIRALEPAELRRATIFATVVGGEVVYVKQA